MKNLPVFALPEVEADLRQAMKHYATWRSDGAVHILNKYDDTIRWIGWNPDTFPKKHGPIQRAILMQSYYIVYFIQESDRSIVLAVLDGRRDPSEIKGILKRRKLSPKKSLPPRTT